MPKDSLTAPLPAQTLRRKVPLSKPLRHPRYRRLWTANLISNLGTWTQTFASAWLIASMSHSASTTTLVQTASYVPIFLFALFAGVIAEHRLEPLPSPRPIVPALLLLRPDDALLLALGRPQQHRPLGTRAQRAPVLLKAGAVPGPLRSRRRRAGHVVSC